MPKDWQQLMILLLLVLRIFLQWRFDVIIVVDKAMTLGARTNPYTNHNKHAWMSLYDGIFSRLFYVVKVVNTYRIAVCEPDATDMNPISY